MRLNRDKHRPIHDLVHSMMVHHAIPTTFDGQVPAFAYGKIDNCLLIGNLYEVPGQDGQMVTGSIRGWSSQCGGKIGLRDVPHLRRNQHHGYLPAVGRGNGRVPAHAGDIFRRSRHERHEPGAISLEMFDWMLETYSKTPKEKLLEFMCGAPGQKQYQAPPQYELAIAYCEGCVDSIYRQQAAKNATQVPGGKND